MTIEDILNSAEISNAQKIAYLKEKTITLPLWGGIHGLEAQYNPKKHPVMNKAKYPDVITDEGVQPVTRITVDLQRLAVKRMTELVAGIPVKRIYSPENERQKEIAYYMEQILQRNRIDSFNVERLNMLYAGCEVMTLWYAIEQDNNMYGFNSKLKFRCRNFSPMLGDDLYPLFDEYGDMTAMSIGYQRKAGKKAIQFFDVYTANRHIKYSNETGDWQETENDDISGIGKIPCIYIYRPTPIWEDSSRIVEEIEWALSRNGNYLRDNSKPIFALFADEIVEYGNEKSPNREFKSILQFPKGSNAGYITWNQATETLKFHIDTLRSLFFTQLQLPDWNYEKMSQQALSGESRKQMFIDAQLKVSDESGRLLEAFDREINVTREFLKLALPEEYTSDVESLKVKNEITPYRIGDEKETIENLLLANGNKPIMSQRESIESYGRTDDVDQTMLQIADENKADLFEPTL